ALVLLHGRVEAAHAGATKVTVTGVSGGSGTGTPRPEQMVLSLLELGGVTGTLYMGTTGGPLPQSHVVARPEDTTGLTEAGGFVYLTFGVGFAPEHTGSWASASSAARYIDGLKFSLPDDYRMTLNVHGLHDPPGTPVTPVPYGHPAEPTGGLGLALPLLLPSAGHPGLALQPSVVPSAYDLTPEARGCLGPQYLWGGDGYGPGYVRDVQDKVRLLNEDKGGEMVD